MFVTLRRLLWCFIMVQSAFAADLAPESGLPTTSSHANWVFSGLVKDENGENYGYFFQMQRNGLQFHSLAALFDAQTKQILLLDESQSLLSEPQTCNWHVGQSFLHFNPINASWIFGVQKRDKSGFNFKVDMLRQPDNSPIAQDLRSDVSLLISQTGHLNGHIKLSKEKEEQFVIAKNAWFRQLSLIGEPSKNHPFTGLLCHFNNGSGFYSMNMAEPDALRGAIAGWQDEQGNSTLISQFISVKQAPEGPWHIHISSPNLHLILSDFLKQDPTMAAGFVKEGNNTGFCMLNKDDIGDRKVIESKL